MMVWAIFIFSRCRACVCVKILISRGKRHRAPGAVIMAGQTVAGRIGSRSVRGRWPVGCVVRCGGGGTVDAQGLADIGKACRLLVPAEGLGLSKTPKAEKRTFREEKT